MAAWRDARHLNPTTPGYGPRPDREHVDRWTEHLRRSLDVHLWLSQHHRGLDPEPVVPLDAAQIRQRLQQLDTIIAAAPADQTRIVHAITTGTLTVSDLQLALTATHATQTARRDWILEHWPHVIEHAELSRLAQQHGPLDHWPVPLQPAAQALLDQLAATSSDTPENRTLDELDAELTATDPRHHARALGDQLADLRRTITRLCDQQRDVAPDQPQRSSDSSTTTSPNYTTATGTSPTSSDATTPKRRCGTSDIVPLK